MIFIVSKKVFIYGICEVVNLFICINKYLRDLIKF